MADQAAGEAGEQGAADRADDVDPQVLQRLDREQAGASERAGFMEAPLVGPANQIANATTAPTATPEDGCRSILSAPGAAFRKPITPRITNIRSRTWLLYSGAGGSSICGAELTPRREDRGG